MGNQCGGLIVVSSIHEKMDSARSPEAGIHTGAMCALNHRSGPVSICASHASPLVFEAGEWKPACP